LGLLLIGKELAVLLVEFELVVYISVFGQVLWQVGIIYFAGYGLAVIEHEEAIRAPYAFQSSTLAEGMYLLEEEYPEEP
jgi:hypothetical protein